MAPRAGRMLFSRGDGAVLAEECGAIADGGRGRWSGAEAAPSVPRSPERRSRLAATAVALHVKLPSRATTVLGEAFTVEVRSYGMRTGAAVRSVEEGTGRGCSSSSEESYFKGAAAESAGIVSWRSSLVAARPIIESCARSDWASASTFCRLASFAASSRTSLATSGPLLAPRIEEGEGAGGAGLDATLSLEGDLVRNDDGAEVG